MKKDIEYKKLKLKSWDHLSQVSKKVVIDGIVTYIVPPNAHGLVNTNIMYDDTFEYLHECATAVLKEKESRGTTISYEEFEKPYIDEDFN